MNEDPQPERRDTGFTIYFGCAFVLAACAYLCRIHAFGLDTDGRIFFESVVLTIMLIFYITAKLIV